METPKRKGLTQSSIDYRFFYHFAAPLHGMAFTYTRAVTLEDAANAFNMGDMAAALQYAKTLRQNQMQSGQAVYIEVLALLASDKASKAAKLLQQYEVMLASSPMTLALGQHAWGRYYLGQGQVEKALPVLKEAVKTLAHSQACLLDYAAACEQTGQYREALAALMGALPHSPLHAALLARIGTCQMRLQEIDGAIAYFKASISLDPAGDAVSLLAEAQALSGAYHACLKTVQRGLSVQPNDARLPYIAAECQRMLGHMAKAATFYDKTLQLEAGHIGAHLGLYKVQERQCQLAAARQTLQKLIRLQPQAAHHWIDLANLYQQEHQHRKAHTALDKAAEILGAQHPDVVYARGFLQLLQGKWQTGLKNYEARWDTTHLGRKYRAVTAPLQSQPWDGTADLTGKKVMVLCEQGAGDLLQFARFIPDLKARGAEVEVLAPPFMVDLCQTFPWIKAVHSRYEHIPPHDYHVSLMSLPHLLGITFDATLWTRPYLSAPKKRRRFSPKFTVGIAWAGDAKNPYDHFRSIPFPQFLPLLRRFGKDVCFVSLQAGERGKEAARWIERGLLKEGAANATTFGETASSIHACDLVISVCTATAHLAGAMGKPTWILLGHYADWRWVGDDSRKTNWYPSARLFRQTTASDWRGVIGEVAGVLVGELP